MTNTSPFSLIGWTKDCKLSLRVALDEAVSRGSSRVKWKHWTFETKEAEKFLGK